MTRKVKGGKPGRRKDLGETYFRSSWEANYARYLNLLVRMGAIVKWAFEPERFDFPIKRGTNSYLPDFKVWPVSGGRKEPPYFVEVKGWMDPVSATKLKRMKKYYPDIKVLLVDKRAYTQLKKEWSRQIPHWE